MPGPARKTAAQRRVEGNPSKRPIPPEPELSPGMPKAPAFLKGEGVKEWKRLGARASELGITTEADWAAFANYCLAWQSYAKIATRYAGMHVGTDDWFRMARVFDRAAYQLLAACRELGFTPVTRGKIALRKVTKERDPFAVYMGGKSQS